MEAVEEIEAEGLKDVKGNAVDLDKRRQRILGVRQMYTWLADRPRLPLPTNYGGLEHSVFVAGRKVITAAAREFDRADKGVDRLYFFVKREFAGGVHYRVETNRQNVCTRRVVGEKRIVKPVMSESVKVGEVEETIEEVEWDCPPSLLGGDSDTLAGGS